MTETTWLWAALVILAVWNIALTFYFVGFLSAIRDGR